MWAEVQPEINMAAKPEIQLRQEIWKIASKFRRQIYRVFDHGELKVCACDCDNDRQTEMGIWPPKPDIITCLELWQMGSKFQRQILGFWTRL